MSDRIDYDNLLNPAQLEAVMTLDGPVLVIAGAGSGKTRTLVYRVARLVESGVSPEAVLLLTFTRKASQEMLDRAAGLADPSCRFVSGGTFHSLAFRVLKIHAEALGYKNSFTIVDRSDMEEILRSLILNLNIPKEGGRFPKRGTVANILSKAANLQQPVDDFMTEEYVQFAEVIPQIKKLEKLYGEYKFKNQLMDYDDLIINLRNLLERESGARSQLAKQYSHIMVDEYQDTNTIQSDIVRWLAHERRNIMVVGDDSQSIYSFRGANYRNMIDFPSLFPDVKIVKLEQNYRSTQPILSLTNTLMDMAEEKYTKCLFTEREGGALPEVVNTRTEPEQALFITTYIQDKLDQGSSIRDFAVLFRAAFHSFELEAQLTRQGLPYVKYGGFKFLESAHIKDFLAHMRVAVNPDEGVSWLRILRLIKNVGQGKSQTLIKWMSENRISPDQFDKWPGAGKRESGLKPLAQLLGRILSGDADPETVVGYVMEYYTPILKEKYDDYPRRLKELEQLTTMARRYRKLRSFLDDLALDPPSSTADVEEVDRKNTLTLSTVHSAKGLEWPTVFIIWAMEGRFPPSRAYSDPFMLEEERRLMYVAATRAKDELILCYPGQEAVSQWGAQSFQGSGLSSFISSLPGDLYSSRSVGGSRRFPTRKNPGRAFHSSFADDKAKSGFSQGEKVTHPAFGPGVVARVIPGNKIEVFFKQAGKKLLHLEYTTLEKG